MVVLNTKEKYLEYLNSNDTRWDFGNQVLYQLCKDYPHHNNEDVIVAKVWLIGRSYAAAIERRRNASVNNDDFYYDVVAPKMISIGKTLDEKIEKINHSNNPIVEDIKEILEVHSFLTKTFNEITGLEKRSLASKYLHFHCPNKFFIYDSRARNAINIFVKRPNKNILKCTEDIDIEYADFVCRMLELQEYLNKNIQVNQSPRKIDNFLLHQITR